MFRNPKAAQIAALNDVARTAMGVAARVVQTAGICALPCQVQSRIRERVETFAEFTPDNDPWGERDCGTFEIAEAVGPRLGDLDTIRVLWKIDYYDRNYEYHSEDPADASKTRRVLTIMLASEY